MRSFFVCVFLLVTVILLSPSTRAQNLSWHQSQGLDGGTVNALVHISSGELLAGTDVGLFYTSDGGAHWEPRGIKAANILSLCSDGTALYAGVGYSAEDGSGGIFRSIDNGVTWQKNLTSEYVWSVAAAPGTIVAGTDANGVFCSSDGAKWTQGLSGLTVFAVCIRGNSIFAATDTAGVFMSTDKGVTWQSSGLAKRGGLYALHYSDNGVLFAGGDAGVFRSVDDGKTWTSVGLNKQTVFAIATSGTTIYVGTDTSGVMSHKAAGAWLESDLIGESIYTLSVDGATSSVFAGAVDDGVFVSNDAAITFESVSTNLTAVPIYCFELGSTSFAGGNGLAQSSDGGVSWEWFDYYGLVYTVHNVASKLLVGTDDGYYVSTDAGASWTQSGLAGEVIYCDVIDSTRGLRAAGTRDNGIFISRDNGKSWSNAVVSSGTVQCLYSGATGLYAGMDDGRLLRSTDSARSWTTLFHDSLNAVRAFNELDNGRLVLGTYGNDVSYSTDNGVNWDHRFLNSILETNVIALVGTGLMVSSPGPEIGLFAGTYGTGVYSAPNQQDWVDVNQGLTNRFILSLAGKDLSMICGTEGGGVFYTSVPSSVEWSSDVASELNVFPNPASENLTLSCAKSQVALTIKIVNSLGRIVHCEQVLPILVSESGSYTISTNGLADGVYCVVVQNGDHVQSTQVVILHE